jgi:hypothetical protein
VDLPWLFDDCVCGQVDQKLIKYSIINIIWEDTSVGAEACQTAQSDLVVLLRRQFEQLGPGRRKPHNLAGRTFYDSYTPHGEAGQCQRIGPRAFAQAGHSGRKAL